MRRGSPRKFGSTSAQNAAAVAGSPCFFGDAGSGGAAEGVVGLLVCFCSATQPGSSSGRKRPTGSR